MSVYFAEAGGYIKIGYSHDPIGRSATITTSGTRPSDLPRGAGVDLIGWVPGDHWREGSIHAQFVDSRVRGEWFRLDREAMHELIWQDPHGVDLHRMSASAVFCALNYPHFTRDELESAGVRIHAATEAEVFASLDSFTA